MKTIFSERCKLILCVAGATLSGLAAAAPDISDVTGRGLRNPIDRDLQQMREDVERYRRSQELQRMQEERRRLEEEPAVREPRAPETDFHFRLEEVTHSVSSVLTEEEIAAATAPYEGRQVGMADIKAMLSDINALYRAKGYVVCEARLRPQRIRGGKLFVTLVEGKTGQVTVTGNEHTTESFVRGAFDLKEGEVANYRNMSSDLVHFNMTHDVVLSIDIRAGTEPGTTDYAIVANEPPNWTASVFADTTGSESTGRPRIGASVTNRSLLGRRDSLTLLGLASQGSKSFMAGYTLPLTSRGTRFSATVSVGDVEVIDGPSAELDVTGDSEYYALRLDHPIYADADMKWTVYGEWSRQKSSTELSGIVINDTKIDSWSSGVEAIFLGERSVFFATIGVSHSTAEEYTFSERWSQNIMTGNVFWRYQWLQGLTSTVSGTWQTVLGGDPLVSAQYFYLGHTSGVRGYDNDVLSAEQGAWVNLQLDWAVAGPGTSLFTFFDAGTLSGTTSYETKTLSSVGAGVTWPLWNNASVTATAAVPLVRDLNEDMHVNKARFDLAFTAVW